MTARRLSVVQVTRRRVNQKKVGNHHGEDEEEEEAVVPSANAPVEEEAVMVIFFNAHVTQLAVFRVVGLKQLREAETGLEGEQKSCKNVSNILFAVAHDKRENVSPHSTDRTCGGSGCFPLGQQYKRTEHLHLLCPVSLGPESEPYRTSPGLERNGPLTPGPKHLSATRIKKVKDELMSF